LTAHTHSQSKPKLQDRTDRAWFGHLLWHTARKGSELFFQPQNDDMTFV